MQQRHFVGSHCVRFRTRKIIIERTCTEPIRLHVVMHIVKVLLVDRPTCPDYDGGQLSTFILQIKGLFLEYAMSSGVVDQRNGPILLSTPKF